MEYQNDAVTTPLGTGQGSGILISASSSNCGKTTFTMGLLRALANRGLKVQPYKCGPDYIDTMFHHLASGRESVNLDTFMSSPQHVRHLFECYGADADVSVIEGVMGLFDGYDKMKGSSAEIATLLGVPVILLVNAKSTAYSVAPLIHGFKTFSPQLRLAGVVFNMVSSESHYKFLKEACLDAGVECLGYLKRNAELTIPGRHLGLTISERQNMERFISLAAQEVEAHVDIDRIVALSHQAKHPAPDILAASLQGEPCPAAGHTPHTTKILLARDEAFNFTYRANLDKLAGMGEVRFFSPLHDATLPCLSSGNEQVMLYLPGGYPELFAKELEANVPMRRAIREFAESGGRILAECGGFMYLCRSIDGTEMCGVLPLEATMEGARLHLGYRQMEWEGHPVRGHEFHYSSIRETTLPDEVKVIRIQHSASGKPVDAPIYRYKNVVAGYTHWYWGERGEWKALLPLGVEGIGQAESEM